jgi:hypothetical protein
VARVALRGSPLVKAGGTDASGVERVPLMAAGARPDVLLARRPGAERASDARPVRRLFFLELAFWNKDRIIRWKIHARLL